MSGPDAYGPPLQPVASALRRPKTLFGSPGTVLGLRASSASGTGPVRTVSVWLYGDPPAGLVDAKLWFLEGSPAGPKVNITGDGSVVPAGTDPDGNPVPAHLTLPVAAEGAALPGRAPYRLGLHRAGLAGLGLTIDPLRRHVPVRLRPECGDLPDCVIVPEPPAPLTPPDYDTLARDYAGLRAMLLERLEALVPGTDRSPADVIVTLVELMAHLGDLLAYRQDRVSTEAWLPTARRRAAVTRHARLVDFAVPPATSAGTVVQVHVQHPGAADADFVVGPGDTATDTAGDPDAEPAAAHFTLETDVDVTVRASHGEVALHDWGEADAVLTAGATSAVLVRPVPGGTISLSAWLPAGSLLAFEVVAPGPPGAHEEWAGRQRRWPPDDGSGGQTRLPLASYPAQVVRVRDAVPFEDPLSPGLRLVRVFWDASEALMRPVPVSIDRSAGTPRVGVARLGLLPAHHGLCVDGGAALLPVDSLTGGRPDPATERVSEYFLPRAGTVGLSSAPGGRPWQLETEVRLPSGVTVRAARVTSLLRAPQEGFSVTVDFDDEEPPRLRFATGVLGVVPPPQSVVTVRHQVGSGPTGNIAANTLTRLVRSMTPHGQPCTWVEALAGVTARNVTPGSGGAAAMALDVVRRDAPQAYAAEPRRAVLVSDLPAFAVQVPGVVRVTARRSWSGSWPVGLVAVEASADVNSAVEDVMDAVRMAGTEVVASPATPVGLLLGLTVCLTPTSDSALARVQILAALRPGRPGTVFAPAAHPLGTSVYTSHVVAAVAALPGVDAVRVTEARRLSDPPGTLENVLLMGPEEIAVCDDDTAAPDRGRIELTIEGGR